ncbi:MAG: UDP-2,3-diacylglucosamine diphosphatase [Gemmatimonadetes bacterium]|nr:UDP-2,3-diacylglucosamine diphosphatase [Gemmatimonadota bacterium]
MDNFSGARSPIFIASDLHAGATPAAQSEAFTAWLRRARENADRIILNGDLFDFWCEYRRGHSKGHEELLRELSRTVTGGVPVTLIAGNHDWWGGRHLEEEVGLEYLKEPLEFTVGGRTVLVAHGDRCGRGDLTYRLLAPLLRSGPVPRAFRALPPGIGDRLAGLVSGSRRRSGPGKGELARSAALREWALEELARRTELDLVVLGHAHVPESVSLGTGRRYINCGDWVYHRTYVVLGEGKPELRHWDGENV